MNQAAQRRQIPQATRAQGFPARLIPAILTLYACMLPREFTFEIATIAFPPYRLVLTLLLPFTVYLATREKLRVSFVDLIVIFASIWIVFAITITEGFDAALVTGSSDALNMLFAYFTGRVALRTSADVRTFVIAIIPGLLICSLSIAAESLMHQQYVRPFVSKLTGFPLLGYRYEERIGLMRAAGPFPHPILAGVFMASFLPLVWYTTKGKPFYRITGMVAVSGFFFSLSSTGFVGFFTSLGLMIINFAQKITKLPLFAAAISALLIMMIVIKSFSSGGLFPWIITHLTFDSGTGYFRLNIWEYAGAEVKNHPIFGIGTRPYVRPRWMVTNSVDSLWLLLALRYGIPTSVAVFLSMVSGAVMGLRGIRSPYPLDRRVGYAIGFSIIAITFTGWSVYLWEGVAIWMTLLNGMAVTFGQHMARWSHTTAPLRPRAPPRRDQRNPPTGVPQLASRQGSS